MKPAFSTADNNARASFECQSIGVWQSDGGETVIRASDPDGFINTIEVERVYPKMDGIVIEAQSVEPSTERGAAALAELSISPDIPPARYRVTLASNRETMSETGRCTIDLMVMPITVDRLRDELDRHVAAGDVESAVAGQLDDMYEETAGHPKRR